MRGSIFAIAIVIAAAHAARAQPEAATPPAPAPVVQPLPAPAPSVASERHGLFGGGGLYGGNISCDGTSCGKFSKGCGAAGYIGYLLSPRLGILFDVWALTARDSTSNSDVSLTFVAATINARYYVLPGLWVQGGLGNGHAEVHVSVFQARSDDVPVGTIAAGIEVARGRAWALDIAFRLAQGTSTKKDQTSGDATTGRMAGIGANLTFFATR